MPTAQTTEPNELVESIHSEVENFYEEWEGEGAAIIPLEHGDEISQREYTQLGTKLRDTIYPPLVLGAAGRARFDIRRTSDQKMLKRLHAWYDDHVNGVEFDHRIDQFQIRPVDPSKASRPFPRWNKLEASEIFMAVQLQYLGPDVDENEQTLRDFAKYELQNLNREDVLDVLNELRGFVPDDEPDDEADGL